MAKRVMVFVLSGIGTVLAVLTFFGFPTWKEFVSPEIWIHFVWDSHAVKMCDQMAGNPEDPDRSDLYPGTMKISDPATTMLLCDRARKANPNLRYQYQFARAQMQNGNRNRGSQEFKRLAAAGYTAAIADYAVYLWQEDRKPEAIPYIKEAAQRNSTVGLVLLSLAEVNEFVPHTPHEPDLLMCKARDAGNAFAADYLKQNAETIQCTDVPGYTRN